MCFGSKETLLEPMNAPLSFALHIFFRSNRPARCWACSPGLGREERMFLSSKGLPVSAERASAVRIAWPPEEESISVFPSKSKGNVSNISTHKILPENLFKVKNSSFVMPEENFDSPYLSVTAELAYYIRKWMQEKGYRDISQTLYYIPLLDHLLQDSGKILGRGKTVEERIKSAVSGKKILEVGCRKGIFLRFLQAHGAIVAGSTGEEYFDAAREILGKNAVVAKAKAQDAGFSKELQNFKPDVILSFNLLDRTRWGKRKVPIGRIYASAYRLASKNTRFYVLPGVEAGSVIPLKEFGKAARITKLAVSTKYADNASKKANYQSARFRIGPKRKSRALI